MWVPGQSSATRPMCTLRKHLVMFGDQQLKIPPYAEASHPRWGLVGVLFSNTSAGSVHMTAPEILLMFQDIRSQRKLRSSYLAPPSGWDVVLKMFGL